MQGEGDYTVVGNDISNIETLRSVIRNQFDRNIVVNFSNQVKESRYTSTCTFINIYALSLSKNFHLQNIS